MDVDAIHVELGNFPLCIFSIKEEYWPMIPMFTYGLNEWVGDKKIRNIYWVWIIFMYPKTVHNHYHNRGAL